MCIHALGGRLSHQLRKTTTHSNFQFILIQTRKIEKKTGKKNLRDMIPSRPDKPEHLPASAKLLLPHVQRTPRRYLGMPRDGVEKEGRRALLCPRNKHARGALETRLRLGHLRCRRPQRAARTMTKCGGFGTNPPGRCTI